MKKFLFLLLPFFAHAQKKITFKPDASGNVIYKATTKSTGLAGGDSAVFTQGTKYVELDSICCANGKKTIVTVWDTLKPVANDTIYLSASYTVKTSPTTQKIKWTNKTAGGIINLPDPSVYPSMVLYFFNNTGEPIQSNRYLYYSIVNPFKKSKYRGTFYSGTNKVTVYNGHYKIIQLSATKQRTKTFSNTHQ